MLINLLSQTFVYKQIRLANNILKLLVKAGINKAITKYNMAFIIMNSVFIILNLLMEGNYNLIFLLLNHFKGSYIAISINYLMKYLFFYIIQF